MVETTTKGVRIIYYTDPYCTWCWGSEPILRHLQIAFGDQVEIVYKMGGLVEDIERFYDPTNDISGLDQVGPHWLEASAEHGMPVDISIFEEFKDELRSTYPASVAYKAAELQDRALAEQYLRRLREAVSAEHLPIHRPEQQIKLAAEVGLDRELFQLDLENGRAAEAFMADVTEAREQGITSFPTFVIENARQERVTLRGFQTFEAFVRVIEKVLDHNLDRQEPMSALRFIADYRRVATREVEEVFELSHGEAVSGLRQLEAAERIRRIPAGNGEFWESMKREA